MKKYVLISLIVHLAILFLFATIETEEAEKEKLANMTEDEKLKYKVDKAKEKINKSKEEALNG